MNNESISQNTLTKYDEIFNLYKDNNFSNHAFPLYLFTSRLYDELGKNNCKDILFMSREGQFLKTLFEKYCDIRKAFGLKVSDTKTHYFYGSRNSIMTASTKKIEEENFEHLFRYFKFFIRPSMFLFSIGFSNKQIEDVSKSFGKEINKFCFNFKTSKTFKKLKQDEVFKKIYEENRLSQSLSFGKYMESFDIDFVNDGLYFVDIGYHGTMQDLIFKYFNEKIKITGYFIKNRSKTSDNNQKIGLLADANRKKLFGSKIHKYDAYNYEQILRADHGRCTGYELVSDDKSVPVLDTEHDDNKIFEKYVKQLQNNILDKFEKIARLTLEENIDNSEIEKIATIYYFETIKNKTKNDFNWILDMQDCHHDDFGYVGYPGRAFARKLRKFAFKLKDDFFILGNNCKIKKMKKNIK